MAKKLVSVVLHKKKVMKPVNKRQKLKTLFTKFSNYMKSDTYMFSLLGSPKSSGALLPSSGGGSYQPTLRRNRKNWLQEVEEYLNCDCYMYAPLFHGSASEIPTKGLEQNTDASKNKDQMEQRTTEETTPPRRITTRPTKRVAVKHVLVDREAVKRVVLQNGGSPSYAPGKELLQESGKAVQNELAAGKV